MLLSSKSQLATHPKNINIKLQKHQLAMLKRAIDIENIESEQNTFGIMNDKPGTGKTYVVLSLIYETKKPKETNIIVVPQNIYSQWITSIEKFSSNLSYTKFINYENIMTLYNDKDILSKTDIILTTSSYYHIIATTLSSLNIIINRVFFDEIDSISNIICTKINANFIWFISASFDVEHLGYYRNKVNNDMIDNITCKCENNFIDENIYLEPPIKTYYLCKNIYIDNILEDIITRKELKGLNAMDYTLTSNRDFEKQKANNEKDVIDMILKNRKSIIEFDKFKIEDAQKQIIYFTKYNDNRIFYEEDFLNKIKTLDEIYNYKEKILNFITDFDNFSTSYINSTILEEDNEFRKNEITSLKNIVIEMRRNEVKSLKILLDDIIDLCYNINTLEEICKRFYDNKRLSAEIDMTLMNIKKLVIVNKNIEKILLNVKDENEIANVYYQLILDNNSYNEDLILKINDFTNMLISDSQLEIFNKLIEVCSKSIYDNENKINLIYQRLSENSCCPVCYEVFNMNENKNEDKNEDKNEAKKIYITHKCCNNKICSTCIDKWYGMDKNNCIFCNCENMSKDDLLYYLPQSCEENIKNKTETEYDHQLIEEKKCNFENFNSNKGDFLNDFISNLKLCDKKIIIFSDYSSIFQYIQKLCDDNDIKYIDLDKGNIKEIDNCVQEYKYGNAKILLSNSTLFGCGMNFENSSDIIFVHKMNESMEKQVIGRAQRFGRTSILNIIYLEYENESTFIVGKNNYFNTDDEDGDSDESKNKLKDFYDNMQLDNIINSVSTLDFSMISSNEIVQNINNNNDNDNEDKVTLLNNDNTVILPDIPSESIDVNLQELISSLF